MTLMTARIPRGATKPLWVSLLTPWFLQWKLRGRRHIPKLKVPRDTPAFSKFLLPRHLSAVHIAGEHMLAIKVTSAGENIWGREVRELSIEALTGNGRDFVVVYHLAPQIILFIETTAQQ